MKKLMNLSLVYLIAALAFGVFYREFTKLNNFAGETMLRAVHTHLFMLGVVALLCWRCLSGTVRRWCKAERCAAS
ncbi:MAG: DUF2871 family protein [Merdibacter sp.]